MKQLSFLLSLVLVIILSACGDGERRLEQTTPAPASIERRETIVFAAASLKEAFEKIGRMVEAEDSSVKITFSFAASNMLARQIESGAPVDLFASAAENVMDSLALHGRIDTATRASFARNRLVVVTGTDSALGKLNGLAELTSPRYRHIAIGAPGVPVRVYTEQVLRAEKLWEKLEPKFVNAENVRQVVDYVAGGDAEAGLVYSSDAKQFSGKIREMFPVDLSLHSPISYPVAIVKDGNRAGAESFLRALLGERGRAVLTEHGFSVP